MEQDRGILFFDLETAPNIGYSWGLYEQNIIRFVRQWYILTFSAKWYGGETITKGLSDYKEFKKDTQSDRELVKELWHLLDRASVVIAHNGDQFDIKKINARFSYYNLPPPSPYKTIDTKKIAKRYYGFNSNKLDDLGEYLKLGRKMDHEGFTLWERCMAGERKAFEEMKHYNKQDVILLEKIYLHFRPWIKSHPALGVDDSRGHCPRCGGTQLEKRGFAFTSVSKFQIFRCQKCNGFIRGSTNLNYDEGVKRKPFVAI